MCVGPRCPAAALSLTCIPVLGGSTDFTVLFNRGQVTWAPSGLSWLCGHRSKRELGLAMSLQQQGKDRALGSLSLGMAWSCRNPSRGAELPLTAPGWHLQPCRHLVPLPAPSTQEPWLLELSGNWELYSRGFCREWFRQVPPRESSWCSCASPCGTDKGAPPALLSFRNGCDEEKDLGWKFPSFPALD